MWQQGNLPQPALSRGQFTEQQERPPSFVVGAGPVRESRGSVSCRAWSWWSPPARTGGPVRTRQRVRWRGSYAGQHRARCVVRSPVRVVDDSAERRGLTASRAVVPGAAHVAVLAVCTSRHDPATGAGSARRSGRRSDRFRDRRGGGARGRRMRLQHHPEHDEQPTTPSISTSASAVVSSGSSGKAGSSTRPATRPAKNRSVRPATNYRRPSMR